MSKIAIVFGGVSYEHEISIVSAITLKKVLNNNELIFIFLDKDRDFYLIDSNRLTSKLFQNTKYKKCSKLILKSGGFYTKAFLKNNNIVYDFMINLIHGGDGEDGKLASIFDFYGIDYIGPRIEASVISSNKYLTKLYAKELKIDVIEYEVLNQEDKRNITIKYPVIIKPLRLGSSIGVSIVNTKDELDYALDVAFEFDSDVLIERYIPNIKEYNLAGIKTKDGFIYSIIEEPQKDNILTFEKKYLDFAQDKKITKAKIESTLESDIQTKFAKIYGNFFIGSLIRCDFFVIDNMVYLNEINPIPGSMANYQFEDFDNVIKLLSNNLPKYKNIAIDYNYISRIASAKGKA